MYIGREKNKKYNRIRKENEDERMKNLKPCGTFHVLFKGKLVFALARFATNELVNMFQFCFALTVP